MKNTLILLAIVALLGACAQMGEGPAGAEASMASSGLTAAQKQEGIAKLSDIAQQLLDAHKLYDDAAKLAKNQRLQGGALQFGD